MLKNQRKDTYNTNCVAKVCECAGLESPLTPTLSPLTRRERAGSGGILHAQEFVNSGSAIGIRRGTLAAGAVTPPRGAAGWKERLFGEGLLSEALEALSPSVGSDGGELREVEADAGLGEGSERDEGAQEPVEAFALRRCEGVLEVLHQRCNRVLFCRVVPFGCYHSG